MKKYLLNIGIFITTFAIAKVITHSPYIALDTKEEYFYSFLIALGFTIIKNFSKND